MILLRSSIFFLLCGVICCQESVSTAHTDDTKLLQPDDQHQESPTSMIKQEDSPKMDEAEKLVQSEKAVLVDGHESQPKADDDQQFAARRRLCCQDGRQHFYMNGHCANRSKEELEAVGPWCDQKFLECCDFMESYYMGGSRCRNIHQQKINPEDSPRTDEVQEPVQPGNASLVDGHESQPKPDATPDSQQVAATRRKCCDDGRQHFYMNGHCANRSKEELEAVGPWCDQKFLECCDFMESYYMGGSRCRNKHQQKINPEDSPRKDEEDKSVQPERKVLLDNQEAPPKPDATPVDSPRKDEEDKSVQPERKVLLDNQEAPPKPDATPVDSPRKDEVQEPVQSGNASLVDDHESQPKPDATPDRPQVAARRRQCCDDGREHFYMNGNCANRPREKNEAVGLWCDRKFLECCVFMESYYMGPVQRRRCQNKHHPTQLPSPTDTSNVTKEGLNQ